MGSVISALAIAFLLYIFTFFMDGDIGIVLISFMVIAPLVSLAFGLGGRKRAKVSLSCDGFVKNGSRLKVTVTVEKSGFFPLGMIELHTSATESLSREKDIYRLTVIGRDSRSFTYELEAKIGGNGRIAVTDAYSCGFLGFLKFRLAAPLPPEISVGVIPEIPEASSASGLVRAIADSVFTSDEEESSDTALLFSAATAPGYEHREYEQGDPIKRINWKLSVKKDKLMVRLDEAVASVQPIVALDLYRQDAASAEVLANEERIICSAFALVSLLVKQGIACTFIYFGSDGETASEIVETPDQTEQLLLKVVAARVVPERRIKLSDTSACACVIASTDLGAELADIAAAFEDKDCVSLIGKSADAENRTDLPMWYLDGDNNFKQV
ncbi:MAG: DUF58 domain-containing protein [Alistipes sp.]|nr:DUF58 domain-containing protein [Alistipes sp.]